MPRGGARAGAGRKPGGRNIKTAEIATKVALSGLTPLEVMVEAMLELHAKGDKVAAATIAKDAAPYVHPRLTSVELDAHVRRDPIDLTMDELLAIAATGRADGGGPDASAEDAGRLH
jgi:hypothetical protein